jgi:WD40 repeat protein
MVTASKDSRIGIWDLEGGTLLRTIREGSDGVPSLAVSPDGKQVVSASEVGLKIWDLDKRKLLSSFHGEESITCLCTANPETIVAGSLNGAVHILRLQE